MVTAASIPLGSRCEKCVCVCDASRRSARSTRRTLASRSARTRATSGRSTRLRRCARPSIPTSSRRHRTHTANIVGVVAASRRGRHFHPLQNTQTRRCLAPQVWGRGAHVRPTRVSIVRARTSPRRMLCGMRCAVVRHHAAPITSHILPLSRVPTDERRRTGMTTISAVDEDRAGLARRRARVRAPAERGGLPRDDRGGWWDLAMTCVT